MAFGDIYFSDSFPLAKEDKVIYHKYSHAVINDTNAGIQSLNNEEGAISEGTPDYWAGSFTGRPKILNCAHPAKQRDMANPEISSYSGYEYERENVPPYDNVPVHEGGEFFSSVLWALRDSMSTSHLDLLVYETIKSIPANPTFLDFRDGLITADEAVPEDNHETEIYNTFADARIVAPFAVLLGGGIFRPAAHGIVVQLLLVVTFPTAFSGIVMAARWAAMMTATVSRSYPRMKAEASKSVLR